jgi:hypothetical protein
MALPATYDFRRLQIEDETQSDVDEKYETTSNTVESAGGGRASQNQPAHAYRPVKSTPTAILSLCNVSVLPPLRIHLAGSEWYPRPSPCTIQKVNELVQERRLSLDDKNKLSLPKMLTLDNEDACDEEQM